MEHEAPPPTEFLIFLPIGHTGEVARDELARAGYQSRVVQRVDQLKEAIGLQTTALLIAIETLGRDTLPRLQDALASLPDWWRVPLFIFVSHETATAARDGGPALLTRLEALQPYADTIFVERPLSRRSFLSLVQTAVRSQHQQRRIRQLVDELAADKASLEERVAERTADLEAVTEKSKHLASQLARAEQEERRRIARILHDDIQQILYSVQLQLTMVSVELNAPRAAELRQNLDEISAVVDGAIEIARTLSTELSPMRLPQDNLAEDLARLAEEMERRYDLLVEVDADEAADLDDETVHELLLQTVRELLFNVVKHAGVDTATLRLSQTENKHGEAFIQIEVADNGRGFDPGRATEGNHRGLGLSQAAERLPLFDVAFDLDSEPGVGTFVTLTVKK